MDLISNPNGTGRCCVDTADIAPPVHEVCGGPEVFREDVEEEVSVFTSCNVIAILIQCLVICLPGVLVWDLECAPDYDGNLKSKLIVLIGGEKYGPEEMPASIGLKGGKYIMTFKPGDQKVCY